VGAWTIDDRIPSRHSHGHHKLNDHKRLSDITRRLPHFIHRGGLTYWMPSLLSKQSGNNADAAGYMAQFFFWFVIVRLSAAALAVWVSTLGFALLGLLGLCLSLWGS